MSGFRLNVDKTQILTFAALSPALSPMLITSDAPAKALGILVAPNLPPMVRFNNVFDRFVSRLSLWLYKARTYAGKVAILHFICLPVLWYQLSFVPADKELAKLIEKVMLQFMHGEEINPASTTTGLRLVKKEIVFADKDSCGQDLHTSLDLWQQHTSLDLWQQHNRSVMIRCVQAFATPKSKSKMASWSQASPCTATTRSSAQERIRQSVQLTQATQSRPLTQPTPHS
ncbi:Aste57867_2319 [Aphanomyces stellatus]|uniref:Aste57867_2319 protein n=1 Tax=Aphanomyces stellatus TaxID=120398 RepID=A0A485KB14_9STRA|nr:hypothetical protein As57867_002314 [Aphanomyces stellatus]VFT79521.1 Aste57867_2319 [Aphanomyces stellatus]